ncbi:ABC transporter ATP-binding protein [Limimaricola sp. G21655-S1]|uniref:ABC transporter ATP-binding protein n=1 Tax=Limimaricola sp. G21655-S1 TaxID=3014768 RepID=UPI0022B05130|nr:ABC transporter ATP-binding protein [Limimaricola sp. G21655-S1]MCZ4262110.1 ABC transporter ATP-binding protein [Limimaricola sp. G21655-S1]
MTMARAKASATTVVEARGLDKSFGSVIAVDKADFEIKRGEFISIVGPSGCGKSTLLRMIAGLTPRSGGSLSVNGREVTGPRGDVGVMFQKPTLLEWKTVIENVLLPTALKGRVSEADRSKAQALLNLVGLQDFAHAFPRHLSGGMQQRVALARLLKIGSDILLLDEPFGALDEFTREHLNLELSRIVSDANVTSVFVTHNISEAIFLADKVFVMTPRPGRLAAVVDVPFPRPRELSLLANPDFVDLVARVRDIFSKGETA